MVEPEKELVSLQDENIRNNIRTLFLDGKSFKQIQIKLGINRATWEVNHWRDTNGFRTFIHKIKVEKMLVDAERVSSKILNLKTAKNARMLAIQQREAEFVRETQGKDLGYSKRIETLGLNINHTEPLNEEQKANLNRLLKKSGKAIIATDVEVVTPTENVQKEGSTEPLN